MVNSPELTGALDAGLTMLDFDGSEMRFLFTGTSSEINRLEEVGLSLGVLWERTLASADFVAAM